MWKEDVWPNQVTVLVFAWRN